MSEVIGMNFPWKYTYFIDGPDRQGGYGEVSDSSGNLVAQTAGPAYAQWHEGEDRHFTRLAALVASAPKLLGLLFHRYDEAMEAAHDVWINRRISEAAIGNDVPSWRESAEYIGLIQEWADELDVLTEFYGEDSF
jgi:hypothetical protein